MAQYINKSAVVAEILRRRKSIPSDEKDKRFRSVYGVETFVLTELINFVESLPVINIEKELLEYKSDVWTENDRTILDGIIDEIKANKNSAPSYDLPTYDKYLNWLKSLKNKIKNE